MDNRDDEPIDYNVRYDDFYDSQIGIYSKDEVNENWKLGK